MIDKIKIFNKYYLIEKSLAETKKKYRLYDPGWYLYKMVIKYNFSKKFTDDFCELVYVTLSAWNMNSRGAKLEELETFKKSILRQRELFTLLNKESLKSISNKNVVTFLN
jgi:hypothetical protein